MITTAGERLTKFRYQANLSQLELQARLAAMGIELPDGAISKIESGRRNMSVDELFCISEVLGVSMQCLSHGKCETSDEWLRLTESLSENQTQALMMLIEHNLPLLKAHV